MITVEEINSTKFKTDKKNNYDYTQVDAFMDRIAGEIDLLNGEAERLKARNEELEKQLQQYRAKESAIERAMLEAGELRASIIAKTEKEAAKIINGAESDIQIQREKLKAIKEEQEKAEKRVRYILEAQLANLNYILENFEADQQKAG